MKTVLVVEDNPMNMEFVVQILEDDYRLVLARDGKAGVELADSERPDVVLMDLSLPVMDGWEAIRTIRRSQTVPIVVLSAHARESDIARAFAAGADDYLVKPVDEDRLREVVGQMCAGKAGADAAWPGT